LNAGILASVDHVPDLLAARAVGLISTTRAII